MRVKIIRDAKQQHSRHNGFLPEKIKQRYGRKRCGHGAVEVAAGEDAQAVKPLHNGVFSCRHAHAEHHDGKNNKSPGMGCVAECPAAEKRGKSGYKHHSSQTEEIHQPPEHRYHPRCRSRAAGNCGNVAYGTLTQVQLSGGVEHLHGRIVQSDYAYTGRTYPERDEFCAHDRTEQSQHLHTPEDAHSFEYACGKGTCMCSFEFLHVLACDYCPSHSEGSSFSRSWRISK